MDPLTSRPYTSIKAAQTAAQSYDSCYGVGEKDTATTHTDAARGEQHKSHRHRDDDQEVEGMSLTVNLGIVNCDSTYHASYD